MEEAFINGFVDGVEKVAAEFPPEKEEKEEKPKKEKKEKEEKEEKEDKGDEKNASFGAIRGKLGVGGQEEDKTASAGDRLREKFGLTKKAEKEETEEEGSAFDAWKSTL